jgi:ABC-type multidrug transport system fused ATPase/permease subunit
MLSLDNLMIIAVLICFMALILFVVFGQVTVRKLRRNSETKDHLGVEFASGWDILNVAQALSLPRSWNKRMENSSLSFLRANPEKLVKHTTKFDRILAKLLYFVSLTSVLMLITLALLNTVGVIT